MASTIDQYREAKTTFLKLREQAKKDLLSRFHALSDELFLIQKELRDDFGHKIAVPTKPKAGRARKKVAPPPAKSPAAASASNHPKIVAIEKKIALHKRKMDEADKVGKISQALKDKMYELEDDLRLARENA